MSSRKIIWIKADSLDKKDIVTTALENGFLDIVVDKTRNFEHLGRVNAIVLSGNDLIIQDTKIGEYVTIESKRELETVKKLANKLDYVVVSTKDWKVIPVENLIALFQNSNTKLLAEVGTIEDAKLFLETLEVGVDGLLLNTKDSRVVVELKSMLENLAEESVKLIPARIAMIRPIGSGDRVCIDSCSILKVGEGMLVGSQAGGLFLAHSETLTSQYIEARPFRVNAGAVHAYILVPGGKTKYLSELKAGDAVLVVDSHGNARAVIIGRLKIEKRPLVLVEAEVDKIRYNIILQNAETVNLVSEKGPVSVAALKEGDIVLMHVEVVGRHFGMPIKETILEK